jgi:hypothetical protein
MERSKPQTDVVPRPRDYVGQEGHKDHKNEIDKN